MKNLFAICRPQLLQSCINFAFYSVLIVNAFSCSDQVQASVPEAENSDGEWTLAFSDDCTEDWRESWTLDGLIASVNNSEKGMQLTAGPELKNNAHHAVLWTKDSFVGDIKIEYDFTKTDTVSSLVNILYIQATGDEEGVYEKDISKWKELRDTPTMSTYFENMNALHVSYAAFGSDGTYVRARRYPKKNGQRFKSTQITPSYDGEGEFKTGQTYHITAIKLADKLTFQVESKDGTEAFDWDITTVPPITEGRVGLRHMYTRSSVYKDFKVYTK